MIARLNHSQVCWKLTEIHCNSSPAISAQDLAFEPRAAQTQFTPDLP